MLRREDDGVSSHPLKRTSRYVALLFVLFFSHTDLVPAVGPGTKELVTTPTTGLRSLNTSDNTIQPLVYLPGFTPCVQASETTD